MCHSAPHSRIRRASRSVLRRMESRTCPSAPRRPCHNGLRNRPRSAPHRAMASACLKELHSAPNRTIRLRQGILSSRNNHTETCIAEVAHLIRSRQFTTHRADRKECLHATMGHHSLSSPHVISLLRGHSVSQMFRSARPLQGTMLLCATSLLSGRHHRHRAACLRLHRGAEEASLARVEEVVPLLVDAEEVDRQLMSASVQ